MLTGEKCQLAVYSGVLHLVTVVLLQYSSTLVAICSKFTGLGALFMLDCFKS